MGRIHIEGYDFELFKEYDRANLSKISSSGQVEWFQARVNLVLIEPLVILADDDYRKIIHGNNGDILLCFGTLICNGIEALGSFLHGKACYKGFRKFVQTYMDNRWQTLRPDGVPYWKALREDFRNGLAHGFTVDKGGFEASANYFEMKDYGLEIDEKLLFQDFRLGYEKYTNDLFRASSIMPLRQKFLKRFKEVYIDERPLSERPSIWQRLLNRLCR